MMSALDTGVLRFKEDGTWKPLVVMGGFATVDSNQLSAPCQLERKVKERKEKKRRDLINLLHSV